MATRTIGSTIQVIARMTLARHWREQVPPVASPTTCPGWRHWSTAALSRAAGNEGDRQQRASTASNASDATVVKRNCERTSRKGGGEWCTAVQIVQSPPYALQRVLTSRSPMPFIGGITKERLLCPFRGRLPSLTLSCRLIRPGRVPVQQPLVLTSCWHLCTSGNACFSLALVERHAYR